MRIGAAISLLVHVVFVAVAIVLGEASLLRHTPAEAVTVDIVSSKDAPPEPKLDLSFPTLSDKPSDDTKTSDSKPVESKPESKPVESKPEIKAETKPAETKKPEPKPVDKKQQTAAKAPAEPPQALQAPQTPTTPSPQPPSPTTTIEISAPQTAGIPYADLSQKFSKLIGEGDNEFDAPAENNAKISVDSAKALRERLRECSVLPTSVSPTDEVKVVLRVALLRNGKLAREPLLIQASASEKGPALFKSALNAILSCQPYTALPADKYDEWKVLDLSFTPKDFKRG